MTTIEWTRNDDGTAGRTWNPTTGCDKVSPGCDNCYAMTMARRLKAMGNPKYQRDGQPPTSGPGFAATVHPDAVNAPLRWRKPSRVFVNSMSDLLHDRIPDEWVAEVFAVMAAARRHTFQLLTKRHGRLRSLLNSADFQLAVSERAAGKGLVEFVWPLSNLWVGVSVENQKWADIRIPLLLATPAAVRWVSAEPLLGPVDLHPWLGWSKDGERRCSNCCLTPLCDEHRQHRDDCHVCNGTGEPQAVISWVVVGGESGPGARWMHPAWAQRIVDDCRAAGVPTFVKQLGTVLGGKAHHDIDSFPAGLQHREYPTQVPA